MAKMTDKDVDEYEAYINDPANEEEINEMIDKQNAELEDSIVTAQGNHQFAVDLSAGIIEPVAERWLKELLGSASIELFDDIAKEKGFERAVYEAVVNEALTDALIESLENIDDTE